MAEPPLSTNDDDLRKPYIIECTLIQDRQDYTQLPLKTIKGDKPVSSHYTYRRANGNCWYPSIANLEYTQRTVCTCARTQRINKIFLYNSFHWLSIALINLS
ncbi:hypothetical protein PGB90_010037 [Kerria lacca]